MLKTLIVKPSTLELYLTHFLELPENLDKLGQLKALIKQATDSGVFGDTKPSINLKALFVSSVYRDYEENGFIFRQPKAFWKLTGSASYRQVPRGKVRLQSYTKKAQGLTLATNPMGGIRISPKQEIVFGLPSWALTNNACQEIQRYLDKDEKAITKACGSPVPVGVISLTCPPEMHPLELPRLFWEYLHHAIQGGEISESTELVRDFYVEPKIVGLVRTRQISHPSGLKAQTFEGGRYREPAYQPYAPVGTKHSNREDTPLPTRETGLGGRPPSRETVQLFSQFTL